MGSLGLLGWGAIVGLVARWGAAGWGGGSESEIKVCKETQEGNGNDQRTVLESCAWLDESRDCVRQEKED